MDVRYTVSQKVDKSQQYSEPFDGKNESIITNIAKNEKN
jgi:hypothetical protein